MNKQCIVYISDRNYAFPTFLSAIQARKFSSSDTDVLVLLSEQLADFDALKSFMSEHGVMLLDYVSEFNDYLDQLDASYFQKQISKTAMCRLLLHKTLPAQYEQIIYLDGDTQVWKPLQRLEAYQVPAGKFLASPDYVSIHDYLKGAPLSRYFNSGVLKFNREGWIGQDAFDLYLSLTRKKEPIKYHDQDALNMVGKDALIYMSNEWNFPKQFLHLLADDAKPAIVHFMAYPKPWHGVYYPWDKQAYNCYKDLKQQSKIVASYFPELSLFRKMVYRYRSIKLTLIDRVDKQHQQRLTELLQGEFEL